VKIFREYLALVHYKVTLIRRFWLDEISHYLYVHWSNRNKIHVILFIYFVRKRKIHSYLILSYHVRRRRWACRSQTEICRNLGDLVSLSLFILM
jgi:hypothetical protein